MGIGLKSGVAEVVGAVFVGAAEGFGDDVDLGGAPDLDRVSGDCNRKGCFTIFQLRTISSGGWGWGR